MTGAASRTKRIELTLQASESSPVVNPAIVVKDWGDSPAKITVGGKNFSPQNLRTGLVHKLDGADLIIWVRIQAITPLRVTIAR